MAAIDNNLVRFNATSSGTANFVVASAVAGCFTPEQASAIDGKVYVYLARSADGTQFESGKGAYVYASHSLARTTIYSTSNKGQSSVNFLTVPIVTVYPAPAPTLEPDAFPSGTTLLFYQAAAPTGWTKLTTQNDKVLRVVSGSGGVAGGSNAFSTVMAQTVVGGTTLSLSQIPSHSHGYLYPIAGVGELDASPVVDAGLGAAAGGGGNTTGPQGGGGSHNHTITMDIAYIDIILAKKN